VIAMVGDVAGVEALPFVAGDFAGS